MATPKKNPPPVIRLQTLTLEQAKAQFPGCDTEEMMLAWANNRVERNYLRLILHEGRLLSAAYEIGWFGWSEWKDGRWRDLDDSDNELWVRFENEDADLKFLPPVAV